MTRVRRSPSVSRAPRRDRRGRRSARDRVVTYRTPACLLADWDANLSRARVFLSTAHPAALGARIGVRLVLRSPPATLRLRGRVASVVRFGNGLNDCPGLTVTLEPGPAFDALAALVQALRRRAACGASSGFELRA